jgi:hypothetical protein
VEEENGLWERFESHLNSGEYEKAEAERRERLDLGEQAWQIPGELPSLHLESGYNIGLWIGVSIGMAAVVLIVFFVCKSRRTKE